MSGPNSRKQQARARDLKHRVLTCIHRLSDRDTHSAAASELESIAKSLSGDAIPPFISSIAATDSSDKSPVRRQCVRLISVLSEHHGNSLSPYLSKILSAVVRRLRDPDSSVRSACVEASLSLSSHITSPPFNSVTKPFLESLFIEQDSNTQTGAALCLAAIIEGSKDPDAGSLRRLFPKLEKLAKSESFKAKAALLTLIGSIVQVKGVLSNGKTAIRNIVMCLMEFLSSEDWAARKAAAEALMKIAIAEKESLSEHKISCLKTFEAKKFDKVRATRETMNQMIEAWKLIPDLPDEVSSIPESEASSKQNASDGCYPPGIKSYCSPGASTTQTRNRSPPSKPTARSLFSNATPASTARKRSPLGSNESKPGRGLFQKLDLKKPTKVEIVGSNGSCGVTVLDDSPSDKGEEERRQTGKTEIKRNLFSENNGKQKLHLFKNSSRVVPWGDASVVVSNETGDTYSNQRGCEDLSQIRMQLVQIENQQSNLMDLLQKFIGSSQNSMHSLEARVHGLELALDEISFDLAVSTGRVSQNGAAGATCCRLPGTDFLSSKLWRRAELRPTTRLPLSRDTPSMAEHNGNGNGFPVENRRYMIQGRRGLIVNPLAKFSSSSLGFSEVSSTGVLNSTGV
ncbi:TORTIFOLIA1-like protein 3 [Andrographis paniculata]|uniref:TORTIFOLIA1-like protein 3 n=1 Tax=Andrographis paniculata TaxID=175694 RepID=UPI0021E8AB3E|nr:TORTIFOLIA1-like protein 3 [Andrographis paniculata]